MNPQVNAVAGRLSLRTPQRRALEILDRVTELVPPRKDTDLAAALRVIQSEFPTVTSFERDFPSVCFALATGVGKTRLMGAFISYLHLAHGIDNFLVLAPNLTIYRKLIVDFTPNTAKYVFKGIAAFATTPPEVITGDDYESKAGSLFQELTRCKVNVFNISKITSEVRGGRMPRIKRLSEYIGESYFEYLAALPDLVLLMDESHRYRASAGVRAINELKPVLGLELTATPYVSAAGGTTPFRNVIVEYPLAQAMADGFVKEPAVVTRKNFAVTGMSQADIERVKLEDGIRLHEAVKVELETYAREMDNHIVKPFVLVIARDVTHAGELLQLVESDGFFDGRYRGRAIQVDSSRTGAEEELMIERLLKVESADEPTEIVIHVNMLKEGWDVTNLYTIIPLRAANARVLIEQSIGRGLRLPYGRRTGVRSVDRLNIVAHDRFQEIVEAARQPHSPIRLQTVELDPATAAARMTTVISQSVLESKLGLRPDHFIETARLAGGEDLPAFPDDGERAVAQLAYSAIQRMAGHPKRLPTVEHLGRPEVQAALVEAVERHYRPEQTELAGVARQLDMASVVARASELVMRDTIGIPRILVVPRGEVTSRFDPFALDLEALRYAAVDEELWVQHLRTGQRDTVAAAVIGPDEARLEDYVVAGLIDFDDVSYDENSELLYDLAGQAVHHFREYLDEAEARKVLRYHQREIARFIHAQMQEHHHEDAAGYDVVVTSGMTPLKPSAYSARVSEPVMQYRTAPADRSNMSAYLFGGFERCLYSVQKFQSDPERKLAVILERESLKWFKPARGQFQIHYRGPDGPAEYQPDFVAETDTVILMLEPKRRGELTSEDVLAKQEAAVEWCRHASDYAAEHGSKPWRYVLIPHDVIAENMTLELLSRS